jgi:hypothetical protein
MMKCKVTKATHTNLTTRTTMRGNKRLIMNLGGSQDNPEKDQHKRNGKESKTAFYPLQLSKLSSAAANRWHPALA